MKNVLGIWKCECCNWSNPDASARCSYCDLPRVHTPDQLEKYKQALPDIKGKGKNIWQDMFSSFVKDVFVRNPKFLFIVIVGLLAIVPVFRDNMLIVMPVAMLVAIIVFGYFYMKK